MRDGSESEAAAVVSALIARGRTRGHLDERGDEEILGYDADGLPR